MKRKFNQFIRSLKKNPRGATFTVAAFLFMGFLLFFAYNKFVVSTLLANDIKITDQKASELGTQISALTGDADYKKFVAGRYIQSSIKVKSWSNTISSLINIFDGFRKMSNGNLKLTDFQIDMDEIKMKGEIGDISLMYGDPNTLSGGIISKIEDLDFIDKIQIPFYSKDGGATVYKFDLDAKIKTNEGATSTASAGKQQTTEPGK